ncbi:MAG: IS110 family transposase [Verrucomicrobia bacterium]|nr:IS110 family transposase [Verrucomicrobiota bacterium]
MASADKPKEEKSIAAFVGIDWADQKHDIAFRAAASQGKLERCRIESHPEALNDWVLQMRERFGSQGKILICLEQSRGALIHFLMGFDCFELYPINPKQLDNYREAFRPSGAKDDPLDAELLCQFLSLHHEQLRPWRPNDEQTRKLALLCEKRRQAIDARTALSNQLKSELKQYFPLALAVLDNDLTTVLAADFLLQWSTFESLKKAAHHKVRKFFYAHQCRSEQKIQARLERIQAAQPLTRDGAIIEASSLTVEMLARQLKDLAPYIARYEKQIEQLFAQHPDRGLFDNLPGAGRQLAPRLLSAFGSDRARFSSALEALTFFGVAPITERSGKTTWIHFRWACPKFLRQSFHEFAGHSLRFCDWAAAFYEQQRARGKGHHAAVRALAYKWIRILFRCWKTRQPYNPDLYLAALSLRSSPLATAVKNSP